MYIIRQGLGDLFLIFNIDQTILLFFIIIEMLYYIGMYYIHTYVYKKKKCYTVRNFEFHNNINIFFCILNIH